MADQALDRAQKTRNDIAADINRAQDHIAELKKKLAAVDGFIEKWYEFAGESPPAENPSVATDGTKIQAVRPKNPKKEKVAAVSREIIAEHGRPMPQRELLAALDDKGVTIQGRDRNKVLSTMLWRTEGQVVRLKGHGYWLPEKAWLAAEYYPDKRTSPDSGLFGEDADLPDVLG